MQPSQRYVFRHRTDPTFFRAEGWVGDAKAALHFTALRDAEDFQRKTPAVADALIVPVTVTENSLLHPHQAKTEYDPFGFNRF